MHRKREEKKVQKEEKVDSQLPRRMVRFNQQQDHLERNIKTTSILKRMSKYCKSGARNNKKGTFSAEPLFYERKPLETQSCQNLLANNKIKNEYIQLKERGSARRKFQDEKFPPTMLSLFPIYSKEKGFKYNIKWMRISQIFKVKDIVMWNSNLSSINIIASTEFCPHYIVQAFNCLRSNRMFLNQIFESQKPNEDGIYYVKLFINSVWKYVVIDDFIPVFEIERENMTSLYQPIFTDVYGKKYSNTQATQMKKYGSPGRVRHLKVNKSIHNQTFSKEPQEIWMFLVEKAYAKVYSSYESLIHGNLLDFMNEITGFDWNYKNFRNIPESFDWKEYFKSNNNMLAIGKRFLSGDLNSMEQESLMFGRKNSNASSKGHIFISDDNSSSDRNEKNERNQKMRTPSFSRKSSQSSLTSHFVRNQKKGLTLVPLTIGVTQKISFYTQRDRLWHKNIIWPDNLTSFFEGIFIWGEHEYGYWGYNNISQHKDSIIVRKFTLASASKTCISIYQKDRKLFGRKSAYDYSWIRLVLLLKEFNGGFRWIDGEYSHRKSVKVESYLEPGTYYALMLPDWKDRPFDLGFVLKTDKPTHIQKVEYEQGCFQQGCADLAQRFGRINQLNKFICSYNCIHEEMGMLIQNVNNEKMLGKVNIRRIMNLFKSEIPLVPFNEVNEENVLEVQIEPQHYYTIVVMMRGGIDRKFFENFNFIS